MEGPEHAFVDYTSSRTNKVGGNRFTPNHGPRNFNDAANAWKEKPNFNWAHTQTFTNPQGGSVSIHSSSYQVKLEKALLDFDSNQEKSDTEKEDISSTNACNLDLGGMVKGKEEVKEQGKEENKMETDMEVDVEIEEEESEFKTDEEVEEIIEEEEDDGDGKNFNSFPTMDELTHPEWLLKNPDLRGQTKLMGLSTDSIPPFAHEENFGHGRTHYYQSLLIGDEYKQDRGERRGIRHLMRLEKEMMDNKGEVT
ncbi:hypothetical protein Tco_1368561 [Tanacetum coccineum]